MKLKLRADYLDTLHKWRRHIEDKGSVGYDIWLEFFELDNAITFADLEVGQAFVWDGNGNHAPRVKLTRNRYAYDSRLSGWIIESGIEGTSRVTPGKIIDGKFVPDEEGK